MSTERLIIRAAEVAGQLSQDERLVHAAHIADEIAWRALNPASAVSDIVADGIRELMLHDGMKKGTLIGDDVDLYQAASEGADIKVLGLQISYKDIGEDLGFTAARRLLPADFLLGDTRKVLNARDRVDDHKDMIQQLSDARVPGL